ncbi:hypothetical protein [Prosthecobacter vanneervenii]|uniref:Lipoprotein n=1 Tax=Prosthecobacter vanneervenii TaxID=48466 RepID=A0A7W7YAX6_9BACT|nr:hypothetical protein [Prosthecobacter vanneervenii]MBB5032816.1 hypothetical protein [Prosthecobacter vanneervenii]
MKSHFHPALALGACIIIGCGVVTMGFARESGQIVAFLAIAFGGWLLKQVMESANKE